jgi:hypothetical protein
MAADDRQNRESSAFRLDFFAARLDIPDHSIDKTI